MPLYIHMYVYTYGSIILTHITLAPTLKFENKLKLLKIEELEMWIYRWMLRNSWTDKDTNERALYRINKAKETSKTTMKRSLHILVT